MPALEKAHAQHKKKEGGFPHISNHILFLFLLFLISEHPSLALTGLVLVRRVPQEMSRGGTFDLAPSTRLNACSDTLFQLLNRITLLTPCHVET